MYNVEKDIENFFFVLKNPLYLFDGMSRIYRNTNEDLSKIFGQFDFKDKNVLSVLASGDQLFSAYYLGASNVDTFDTNRLTLYYFYLKKWAIMMCGNYFIPAGNDDLLDSLNFANNTSEEQKAKYFWKNVLTKLKGSLYYSDVFYKSATLYDLPYRNDCKNFAKTIGNIKPNFKHMDLCIDNFPNKVYDIIILSNILEYVEDHEEDIKEEKVTQNLLNLSDKDTLIIASNVMSYNDFQLDYLDEFFEYQDGIIDYVRLFNNNVPLYRVYRRKGDR